MNSFEQRAQDNYGALIINKAFAREAGFGSRAIPVYVREWIVSHYAGDSPALTEEAKSKIAEFVRNYAPNKSEREAMKNRLFEQNELKLLDNYAVQVNLTKGDRYLIIPFLDESKGVVPPNIVRENEMLLTSGLWGVGTLVYAPPGDDGPGQVILREFTPFQLASLDLEFFISRRGDFTTEEWIDFIVNSMGFNHHIYSPRQKIFLISRLLPMVEPRYNLIELAPKGTGKSFVYENMSRYVAVRSGGITAPVLFYNDARKTPGLITRYDCVVIDEAQKVRGDRSGELTALLKSYLEAGRFGRGSAESIASEAGIVILANIDLDEQRQPLHEVIGLFRHFPNFLQETAFLDRFSGLLPGWDLPRVTNETPSVSMGFKGDIFGEILHMLRNDIGYRDFVKTNMQLENSDDMRDSRAIENGATGLLKILFPNLKPSEEDFYKYCVNPALEMRQRVRDELCKMDREYVSVTMKSKFPDDFQKQHQKIRYVESEILEKIELPKKLQFKEEPNEGILVGDIGEEDETTEELIAKSVKIEEGASGFSYRNLFGPYLKGASVIQLQDPYIRLEFQVRNLMAFIDVVDTVDGPVKLHLTTSSEDDFQKRNNGKKFDEIASNLQEYGITFTHEFNETLHSRGIETDTGWAIKLDRGLDFYQKPESKYQLGEMDQTKRQCRETEIIYLRNDAISAPEFSKDR